MRDFKKSISILVYCFNIYFSTPPIYCPVSFKDKDVHTQYQCSDIGVCKYHLSNGGIFFIECAGWLASFISLESLMFIITYESTHNLT